MRRFTVWALASIALLAVPACSSRGGRTEASAAQCMNDADDDLDGLADCEDPGCAVHTMCDGLRLDGSSIDGGGVLFDGGPPGDRTIPPGCSAPLDIVFVLDVSTSMDDEASELRDGIESIWNAAHALTSDVHFGLVVFVDDALADGGCASFVDLATLRARFDHWRAFCSSNDSPVSMEQNTDCPENSLDALWIASQACGWRTGSTRVIVHVTDDTFAERPTVLSDPIFGSGGVMVQHTYAEVAAELVRLELRVGAFAVPGAGTECGAGTSPDVGRGFHAPYMGMPSLPDQTRGDAWDIRTITTGDEMAVVINGLIADEYCTLF